MPDVSNVSLADLSDRFVRFAAQESCDSSPLYDKLTLAVAKDEDLLRIASHARVGRPVPKLFFASVQYLLLKGAEHRLAEHYQSIVPKPIRGDDVAVHFRDFVLSNHSAIEGLLATKLVQTNEVRRSACLLPGFQRVFEYGGQLPLYLIEIGSSAGLNLLFDFYFYDYKNGQTIGSLDSNVHIICQARGNQEVPIGTTFPKIAARIGVDLNPIDPNDEDAVLWLKALIWPEHSERRELLERAISAASKYPINHIAGDGIGLLPGLLQQVPDNVTPCVFHSFIINQMTPNSVQKLDNAMLDYSKKQKVYCVSIPCKSEDASDLKLATMSDGIKSEAVLAKCSDHGTWIQWL
jgi:hypothetical protein